MNILQFFTQQFLVVAEFFVCCNDNCCFDRSSVIHSSSTGLQDAVDTTRKTEKEMGSYHHHDGYGEQHDRELSSSLLSYLVKDIVDRIDPGYIKGGSLYHA
ncbi:hypothetical protein [Nitrosopumilus sp.]|uniref:hypothetical protein n=1 Tax=Nitrosopumilus sp. TaxID=2024843 RepID=UPI0029316062|nr:hypothetical protein [Nitrosopumilus sp.]